MGAVKIWIKLLNTFMRNLGQYANLSTGLVQTLIDALLTTVQIYFWQSIRRTSNVTVDQ